MSSATTLALIPARGGSKSIPQKNTRDFGGIPLIAHSIRIALSCPSIERTIVSTDCENTAQIAKNWGAEVPFLRPNEISEDLTPDYPVLLHCLDWLKARENYCPEFIVFLRPTSPKRTVEMVESAISLLRSNPEADSVRTVIESAQTPYKMWRKEGKFLSPLMEPPKGIALPAEAFNSPRQLLPTIYWQNGYVDVIRESTIREKKSSTGDRILPLVLSPEHSLDIDQEYQMRPLAP